MRLTFFLILVIASSGAVADMEYTETSDEFGSGVVYSLQITTNDTGPASIFISCLAGKNMEIQLWAKGTMFPDTTSDGGMLISTTHKFDTAGEAETGYWFMNIMKYNNSWYRGDDTAFLNQMAAANRLSVKLNRRSDIYRFKLDGAAPHIEKIMSACVSN